MRVFEPGEVVHIVKNGPIKEAVEDMGFKHSEWPTGPYENEYYHTYAGKEVVISKTLARDTSWGGEYYIEGSKLSFYGQDFEEFYGNYCSVEIEAGDILQILG